MTLPDPKLTKLVALKRQRAEQALLSVQREAARLDKSIADLTSQLNGADEPGQDFEALRLSYQEHFVEGMLGRIGKLRAERETLARRLEQAREELKKAIYSEGQLNRFGKG